MKIPLSPSFTKGDNYPSLWQSLPAGRQGRLGGILRSYFLIIPISNIETQHLVFGLLVIIWSLPACRRQGIWLLEFNG
jgi:hypothetical protein